MSEVEQGTDAWKQLRLGKVTASRVADVIAKTKTGAAASRANYMAELIAERLTGVPTESYMNAAMQWGTEKEPDARAAYEFRTDAMVETIGFVAHPTIGMTGASPDGLVDDIGLVEIKCPQTATHLDTLLGQGLPDKYVVQMQWQMACSGRQWCDFVSYDPRLPESMRLFVRRFQRDPARIAELQHAVIEFLGEIDAKVKRLQSIYDTASGIPADLLMAG